MQERPGVERPKAQVLKTPARNEVQVRCAEGKGCPELLPVMLSVVVIMIIAESGDGQL